MCGGKRRTFAHGGHFHVLHQAVNILNERTLGAVAGEDVHAFIAALECGGAAIQPELAAGFFGAVTAETIIFQNGPDVAGKVYWRGGGGWEAGEVRPVGRRPPRPGERHQQAEADGPAPGGWDGRRFQ